MLMQALVRTPDQHDLAGTSGPRLKPSQHSDLPVAGLQKSATSPSQDNVFQNLIIIKFCNIFHLTDLLPSFIERKRCLIFLNGSMVKFFLGNYN